MRLDRSYSLKEVAELLDAPFFGDPNLQTSGINEIHVVERGDIVFVDHPKYYKSTLASDASIVIINKEQACPDGKGLILVDQPFTAFNHLTSIFHARIESSLEPKPHIGEGTEIGEHVSIGRFVRIGKNTLIRPGVVIYDHSVIGDNVIINANTVIGSDGLYFKKHPTHYEKFVCVGRAVIEDDVELGANCTIDRGVTSDTVIGKGSKLDNMVHIGHDSKIGERCLFAAQVAVAGCVVIKNGCTMWGQSAIAANVVLGAGAVVLAQSGVTKSLPGGKSYFGNPAKGSRQRMRELATIARLAQNK